MDYQHLSYSEAMQLPVLMDNSLIDASTEDVIDPILQIDPILKRSASPAHFVSPWTSPQMQHYLRDNNKSSPIGYPMVEAAIPEAIARRDGVVYPSGLFQRRDSPSFSHSSSTSSGILSPPREGDYYQIHSPPTPTDTTTMPPFFNHYESTGSRSQLYQFTGLAEDCVKPIDISLFQEMPESYYDDNNSGSGFPLRGYSMPSDDGGACIDVCSKLEQVGLTRPISPERFTPVVKEEIHTPEHGRTYPEFVPEDEILSSEEPEPPNLKNEDEDGEYRPNQKHRRTKASAGRITRNRKRPSIPQPAPEAKRPKIESSGSTTISRSAAKPMIQGPKGTFSCTECPKKVSFKDENGLQNHIKKQHTRPFVCVFGFAGCNSTFASKNEWKRHCSSQHLVLNYWVCQQDQCSKISSKSAASNRSRSDPPCSQNTHAPGLPRGTIFNRKDLYTQHLRRMHTPSDLKKQVKQRKPGPEWEATERDHQLKALRTRCDLPTHMRCPAIGCTAHFDGTNAWDDRMEHVAKHLEKAVSGSEPQIEFGGEHDKTLMDWATRADIAIVEKGETGKWKLRNPLKSNGRLAVGMPIEGDEDEDAEGEEVEE
ncbi:hypothetical protein AAE478_006667 [Parahypoxylon ruwenzoriense]